MLNQTEVDEQRVRTMSCSLWFCRSSSHYWASSIKVKTREVRLSSSIKIACTYLFILLKLPLVFNTWRITQTSLNPQMSIMHWISGRWILPLTVDIDIAIHIPTLWVGILCNQWTFTNFRHQEGETRLITFKHLSSLSWAMAPKNNFIMNLGDPSRSSGLLWVSHGFHSTYRCLCTDGIQSWSGYCSHKSYPQLYCHNPRFPMSWAIW